MRRVLFVGLGLLVACGKNERPPVLLNGGPDGGNIITVTGGTTLPDAGAECRAMGVQCDGQTPYQCAADGTRAYMDSCPRERPFCAPGIGCLACLPASSRCNPDRPEVPQRCADDGSRWLDQAACDAAMGQRCTEGRCGDPCQAPDGTQPYLGCDYWATATPNSQLYHGFAFAVALANPQSFPVTVQIRGGALTTPREERLEPGEARAVELPWVDDLVQFSRTYPGCSCEMNARCTGTAPQPARSRVARGGAYHLHATAPVAAYQFNPLTFETRTQGGMCVNSFTNDASLLLSERALTRRYIALTAPQFNPPGFSSLGGFIAVVAVTGETTSVTVQLPRNHGVTEAVNNTVQHDNLMPGDVALIVGSTPGDLSGAIIEASNPVAVFAGHDCTYIPRERPACDHLEEQVLPMETLGRDYVISELRDRSLGSVVRIVAPFDDTVVRFEPSSLSPPRRLAAREVIEFNGHGSFRLRSTRPLLVTQFMIGLGTGSANPDRAGDPALVQEVPVQQFRDRYDFLVPSTYTSNFVGLVVPRGARVLLDGNELTGATETLGAWYVLHAPVMPGRHHLRTAEGVPLGVKVYGTARYTSYMYPGGLDLRLLPPG